MKKILYLIGAMLAMASCNQEMEDGFTTLDGAVSFTTSNSITRAATEKESWSGGESVGIYSKSSDIIDENIQYTAVAGNPVIFTTTADPICYTSLDGTLSFVAYYPYNEDNTGQSIVIDLAESQDDILVSDVVEAVQSATSVDFTFSHILSMVSIEISEGIYITDLSDLRIFIADSYTSATYDLYASEPALNVDTSHKGHIEMSIEVNGDQATATAFVMPYSSYDSDVIFYIEVAERTFFYKMTPTWEAGTIYTYSATVGTTDLISSLREAQVLQVGRIEELSL